MSRYYKRNNESVVPWRNVEEFQNVYKCLYSSSISDKRSAVEQIEVWDSRCYPALPTGIELTVDLVSASIEDALFEVKKTITSARCIRAMYSYAIQRFVSLTLERDQAATLKKTPLNVLAEKFEIPDWMVEMRHDISHSFAPSLSVLRMGAKWALQYLEKNFWKIEAENIKPIVRRPSERKPKILDLIVKYKSIQHQRVEDLVLRDSLVNDCRLVLRKIARYLEDAKREVVEVLVQPGVFICKEDLIKIMKTSLPVYLESEDLSLPTDLEKLWLPIIKSLHLYNVIPLFLEKLLFSQEKNDVPIFQKIAAAWALRIFNATSSLKGKTALDKIFKKKGVVFHLYRLLYASMKGGNKYLIHVFDAIACRLGNKERFADLYCIMGLYQGMFLDKKEKSTGGSKRTRDIMEEIHFTVEDVEEDLQELKSKRRRHEENKWSLSPADINWSQIPLGAIINPIVKVEATEESQPEIVKEKEERFILINENDNEEIPVVKKDTSDSRLKTFTIPDGFDMVYRGKQKN